MIPSITDLPDPLERLAAYRAAREREMVIRALAKEPGERTEADWVTISYSVLGVAAGCHCR